MRILKPHVHLPRGPIKRRFQPEGNEDPRAYRRYINELRWDFGFTCAICRLHEADFAASSAGITSFMSIEHYVPISAAPERVNDYANLLYVCRFCNVARGNLPIESRFGALLLDPTEVAWSEHFSRSDDGVTLVPRDRNAEYTLAAFDVNDPRRIILRRERINKISECLEILQRGPETISGLMKRAQESGETLLFEAANKLQQSLRRATSDIKRYQAIPDDAPDADPASPPEELIEASFELNLE